MFANVVRRVGANLRAPVARTMVARPAAPMVPEPEVAEATLPVILVPLGLMGVAFYNRWVYGTDTGDGSAEDMEYAKRMRALWKEQMPQSTIEEGLKRQDSWKDRDSSGSIYFNKEPVARRIETLQQMNVKESYRKASPGYKEEVELKKLERQESRSGNKFARKNSITHVDGVSKKYQ